MAKAWSFCTLHPTSVSSLTLPLHRPTRPIASVAYPEAAESLIRRITQQRWLARSHNQYLNQLVYGV